MATQTFNSHAVSHGFIAQIAAFFAALGRALAMAKNAQARFDEIQALQALSDADLAERGLTRDTIVRHVYADLMAD